MYPLEMLLFCAMATFITGRKSFYDMNAFAEVYKDLLIELFGVSSTPSHDTFARIFRILDKKLFALCLQKFSEKIGDIMARHVVAIDGKTCRRARDAARKAAHIISAWSPGEKLTPGVCMVGEKSNEIPAVPELLDLLGATLKGTVVTADAFNTQKATAAFWEYARKWHNDVILGVDAHDPEHLKNHRVWQAGIDNVRALGYHLVNDYIF